MNGWLIFFLLLIVGFGMYFTGKCFGIEWALKRVFEGITMENGDELKVSIVERVTIKHKDSDNKSE